MRQNKGCAFLFFIHATLFCGAVASQYYSQFGQDRWLNENIFNGKTNGVFIDIGANDGILYSNSYFFEHYLNWTGICIEPLPNIYQKLEKNRSCICINGCVSDFTGSAKFLECGMLSGLINKISQQHYDDIEKWLGHKCEKIIEVSVFKLMDLIQKYQLNYIDYISIDTEGGELDIIKSIDFDKITIKIIDVENNYSDNRLQLFLEQKGYVLKTTLGVDLIFEKRGSDKEC